MEPPPDRMSPRPRGIVETPLFQDAAFWGLTATQFFGAFNDNLYKQMLLLLAVPVGMAAISSEDQQWIATVVFSAPFVLFSGFAGYLSDRFSKRPIVVLSKVAEIAVMLAGMLAFATYARTGFAGLMFVLFCMGAQSAFFGPGKYGILPEMLRAEYLPRANGVILMTTFLAIILGTASAGLLGDWMIDPHAPLAASAHRLWRGSAFCVGIAILGTATSLLIRRVPPARPGLPFTWGAMGVPRELRGLLRQDRSLTAAVLASCMFWLVGGIAMQGVNSLGLIQLHLSKTATSVLTALIGLGIALGAVAAGRLCHGRADPRVVRRGAWGLVGFSLLIAVCLPHEWHLGADGPSRGVLAMLGLYLILLGASAGLFAIPVQVFLQARPPEGLKGRMIALMNQANFVAILLSGPAYFVFDKVVEAAGWPRSLIFALMAVLMLPVALKYRLPAQTAVSDSADGRK